MNKQINFYSLFSISKFILLLALGLFFVFLDYVFLHRIGAFGCFDDCTNFMTAFFMLFYKKQLYKEVFNNHQMLMIYISYLIQFLLKPQTIYNLVLYHRIFIVIFSILWDIIISSRFKKTGLLFVVFYEMTKFYLFGDRFLAEAVIVYPFVYLIGIFWFYYQNKKIYKYEIILCAVLTWFILFMREPFSLAIVFLYILVLLKEKNRPLKQISLFVFSILSIFTLTTVSIPDYYFNVFVVNSRIELSKDLFSFINLLKIFFYPIYILVAGKTTIIRVVLVLLSIEFIIASFLWLKKTRQYSFYLTLLLILSLTNIRFVEPGIMYFEAFHMIVWYGMFLISTLFLLDNIKQFYQSKKLALFISLTLIFLISISPKAFIWEKINKTVEFNNGYGKYYIYGELIKSMADTNSTLFLDGFDDLIYWQAKLISPYKYTWYTSFMPNFDVYVKARFEMFDNNPPDFYYGNCIKELGTNRQLPSNRLDDYAVLFYNNKPTCLYVKKTKKVSLKSKIIQNLSKQGYTFN